MGFGAEPLGIAVSDFLDGEYEWTDEDGLREKLAQAVPHFVQTDEQLAETWCVGTPELRSLPAEDVAAHIRGACSAGCKACAVLDDPRHDELRMRREDALAEERAAVYATHYDGTCDPKTCVVHELLRTYAAEREKADREHVQHQGAPQISCQRCRDGVPT